VRCSTSLRSRWSGSEEVLADVGATGDRVLLEFTVDGVRHLVDENAVRVTGEEVVPLAAPDDLDHVPAGAAEEPLELLDDLAVATNRTVEALQIAVDHEREVVESFTCGQRKCRHRFGLVHLAVAEERPDAAAGRVGQAAVGEVGG